MVDQSPESRAVPRGELQADHGAVGATDEGQQAWHADHVEQRGDGIGLVGRIDRRVEVAVRTEPVEGDEAMLAGSSARPSPIWASHHPGVGSAGIARDVTIGRDAAGNDHQR